MDAVEVMETPTKRGKTANPDVKPARNRTPPPDAASAPEPDRAPRRSRATAESLALKQRDISVSEFFAKNRHLLGFDSPRKALLTTIKEAVDNSLDACEEAGILPDIAVVIEDLEDSSKPAKQQSSKEEGDDGKKKPRVAQSSRYRVTVIDNGPGIVRKQVEHIFGRLLYGSKFHRLKMSRGQQGIGISAAGMYGLITTGRPMVIHTRPKARQAAHHIELAMNTKTNRAEVTVDVETEDFPPARFREGKGIASLRAVRDLVASGDFLNPDTFKTGTSVSIELEARYQKGRGSVDEFLELTAIANPHARIVYIPPGKENSEEPEELEVRRGRKGLFAGEPTPAQPAAPTPAPPPSPGATTEFTPSLQTEEKDGVIIFPRAVTELPPETQEIQPHPRGIELGILLQMLKEAEHDKPGGTLYNFLQHAFTRVSSSTAGALCKAIGVSSRTKVADIDHALAEKLFRELQEAKLPPPPTDCLAPIGVRQLLSGLLKGVKAEFYAASSREPAVYRGRPFQIESAIAFGGELPADEAARVIRFANRVPLLYQQSACSSFKAVVDTNWRNYDLQHPKNSLPIGALVIMIHMASVWVPFTSESKEAIADYDEIRKEMRLALMECGRKLGTYLRKRAKMRREGERRDIFERYIGEVAKAVNAINGADAKELYDKLLSQAKRRTAIADVELDEEGKAIKQAKDDLAAEEGVVIVESAIPGSLKEPGAPATGGPKLPEPRPQSPGVITRAADGGDRGKSRSAKPQNRSKKPSSRTSDPFLLTNSEAAALKVNSLHDESRPSRPKGAPSAGEGSRTSKPLATPTPAPKKPKPKMRLVNGKLIPVEEPPRLF